ncbi:alpha/beta hydrolase family protein [Pedobacter alluvionis]|nr:prolyl oligopeptidase family serine peptidase [Pedobacter alluvionis]
MALVKRNDYFSFIKDHKLLVAGERTAELIDLISLEKMIYNDTKQASALPKYHHFLLWNKDNRLSLYGSSGNLLNEIEKVTHYVTDKQQLIFAVCKEGGANRLTLLTDKKAIPVYETDSEIRRVELTNSGKYVTITEILKDQPQLIVTLVNTKTHEITHLKLGDSTYLNSVKIVETLDGNSFFIDVDKQIRTDIEYDIPDIWYANDGNLKAKKTGSNAKNEYYLWKLGMLEPHKLPSIKYPLFAPIHNPRYLLAFDAYQDYNYVTHFPVIKIQLYDTVIKKFTEIFDQSENLVASPVSDHLLSFNYLKKKWELFDIKLQQKLMIDALNLDRPFFDEEGKNIYFESKNGLLRFNIGLKKLEVIKNTSGLSSTVLNFQSPYISNYNSIRASGLYPDKITVIKLLDSINKTSFLSYHKGTFKEIIPSVSNLVSEMVLTAEGNDAFSVEENFNLPTAVYYHDLKRKKKSVLFSGNKKDDTAALMRQEIIHYINSDGKSLKGLLYYPMRFNPFKKYPLIVSIYKIQHKLSNVYFYPNGDAVGFDLRSLLDQGYFVYLPDIVFGSKGPGLSALDCVDSSIDALSSYKNIDMQKIGLTGHSMGGYETNFIATYSKLFAAYIAGSANSDIVRTYFSYHNDTGNPYFWQFENGQYEMPGAFTDYKELYVKNNPIYNVDQISSPILLWTGMKDENVLWDHTREFFGGMVRNRKQAIALFYPKGDHNLGKDTAESRDLNLRNLEWWNYFLKDMHDVEWINKQIKKGR